MCITEIQMSRPLIGTLPIYNSDPLEMSHKIPRLKLEKKKDQLADVTKPGKQLFYIPES